MHSGSDDPRHPTVSPDDLIWLRGANLALSDGKYSDAATLFELLAGDAETENSPLTPAFHVQMGYCKIMAGTTTDGLQDIIRGLMSFATDGRLAKSSHTCYRIVNELAASGRNQEAQTIEGYFKHSGLGIPINPAPPSRYAIPTHCPGCYAPLHADEVEWLENATAICQYCGSVMHGA